MEDDRDAEDAIRALDNLEFGRQRRRLRVEWAKVCSSATAHLLFFLAAVLRAFNKAIRFTGRWTIENKGAISPKQ